MKNISFEQWYDEDIEEVFGMERADEREKHLQKSLKINVDTWNEEELKVIFIAPLLSEIDFNNPPHYKVFLKRKASIKTENVETQKKVEWMVAQGRHRPKSPFFFLHEYKKEGGGTYNPLGQLLVAMVYAQKENQDDNNLLIYGSYVVGRFWFFVVLKDKKYVVSRAYDAIQDDDLPQIIENLKKVKKYIHHTLNLDEPIFEE